MNWLPWERDFGQLQLVCSGSSEGENYHPVLLPFPLQKATLFSPPLFCVLC